MGWNSEARTADRAAAGTATDAASQNANSIQESGPDARAAPDLHLLINLSVSWWLGWIASITRSTGS